MIYKSDILQKKIINKMLNSSIENPRLDTKVLLANALGCSVDRITIDELIEISNSQMKVIDKSIDRRIRGEPVSRIIGKREFWSLDFKITRATLDPRHETETLIDVILNYIHLAKNNLSILDLGTGSGCILLSLLSELKCASGVGLDISYDAIKVAKFNCEALGLSDRAQFIVSDWFGSINSKFDILVSNPPYVKVNDFSNLQVEVKSFDPKIALIGGSDGLEAYRVITSGAKKLLKKDGVIVLEIGFNQKKLVEDLLFAQGFNKITCHNDLSGNFRCISASNM